MISFIFTRFLTRPIYSLMSAARSIGEGRFDVPLPAPSRDEIGYLSREFGEMAQKLKELDEMKERFIQSVSHELKSPLGAAQAYVELLKVGKAGPLPAQAVKILEIVQQAIDRLRRFITDILDLAKLEAGRVGLNLQT
ncbi:MAG: HAMP domain-containing protein, partial [Elusimicrobia bacterium]|nr:HAMP domain-containing protein [Elusimicrobiota bacterium]